MKKEIKDQAQPKCAYLTITAEFDLVQGNYITDVMDVVNQAVETLRGQGTVKTASLIVPPMNVDMLK